MAILKVNNYLYLLFEVLQKVSYSLKYLVLKGKWSELRKSERRKPKRTPKTMQTITTSKRRSERRKANFQNVEKRIITTSKRVDHYYEYHNVEKNVESLKMTFDVLIFLDAIGNIRTSKVLVHFLAKKLSTF